MQGDAGPSRVAASGLLADAVALTTRLPQVMAAVEAGAVHEAGAHVMVAETALLDPAVAGRVADAIVCRAALRTVPQIRRATRTAVARVDPVGATERTARAVKGRFLRPLKEVDRDMVSWYGWLPVAESAAVWDRLGALATATKVPGEVRGIDARRADVATALLLGRPVLTPDGRDLNTGAVPYSRVWRTDVVVEATTLAGADEHPGTMPGWGTVTAGTARLLASAVMGGDGQWRRMLTDPVTHLVKDYGTARYRPPQALADYVRARDGRCYEPLCLCSAWRGDLDHIRSSPAGPSPDPDPDGRTSADNLVRVVGVATARSWPPGGTWSVRARAPSSGRRRRATSTPENPSRPSTGSPRPRSSPMPRRANHPPIPRPRTTPSPTPTRRSDPPF